MLFTKDNFRNLDDIQFTDFANLNGYKSFLEDQVATAKETIAVYETEIAACSERLKAFATDTVKAVQTKAEEVVEVAQDKVEEVVETVKEEAKKAAPKKAAAKKPASKKEEATPEKEADSDK